MKEFWFIGFLWEIICYDKLDWVVYCDVWLYWIYVFEVMCGLGVLSKMNVEMVFLEYLFEFGY